MTAMLLFEGRMAPEYDSAELGRLWQELFDLAEAEFGCLGHSGYQGAQGTSFGVYTFRDLPSLQAFKADLGHQAVQRRAAEFFASLSLTVVTVEYSYELDLTAG